ncbi:hypothetical protein C0991_009018 [Blastosporella zonata]|nr:hypothetical protein C0991_009018 [Blastosporella zonata]
MKHCEEFRYSPHADIAAPDRATFVKQVAASAAIGEVKRNKSLANMNDELEKMHFKKKPFWAPKEFKAGLYDELKALLHKAADELPEGLVATS